MLKPVSWSSCLSTKGGITWIATRNERVCVCAGAAAPALANGTPLPAQTVRRTIPATTSQVPIDAPDAPCEPPQCTVQVIDRAQPPPPLTVGGLLGSSAGTGLSGRWRFGTRSFDAPPGNRLMLGYLMTDWSNSMSAG